MSVKFGVKSNWIVKILSIVFIVFAILSAIGSIAMIAFPQMLGYEFWMVSGLRSSGQVMYAGVSGGIMAVFMLVIGITGLRGKYYAGKWCAWLMIVWSFVGCIICLASGFGAAAAGEALLGIVLPALWLYGCHMSEEVLTTW